MKIQFLLILLVILSSCSALDKCNKLEPNQKDMCINDLAIQKIDINICENSETPHVCYMTYATKLNDIDACEKLNSQQWEYCIMMIGYNLDDRTVCEKLDIMKPQCDAHFNAVV